MSLFPPPLGASGDLGPVTRIVAALTARERALFLEAALPRHASASRIRFADDGDLRPEVWGARCEEWRPEVLLTAWSTPPLPDAWVGRHDCPLRYLCHVTGSVRQIVPRSFLERGGCATNWGEEISGQVAEHGLLLALAALRNLPAWPLFIARPVPLRHITDLNTRTLFGLRVGLHGFGSIARALLPLLRPFGVSLAAYSAGVPLEYYTQHNVRPARSLKALFADSDVLIECESLTPATRGTVTGEILAALPSGAVFVNIGRGAVVDEEALLREAATGRLRVALDVSTAEPLTPDSPVVRNGRVILSPHIGGPTMDRYADCGARALDNLDRFLDGRPLDSVISLAAYDRAT
ncbi:MAG: hydroxyacid dehydrogenase [Opitutaceae bacterium]|nr:hydroxyacid dehydrogenase [Opitutaceae bacterium]